MKNIKGQFYGWILTVFFWIVQLNDFWRVLWFFDTLTQDGQLSSLLMTLVVELGMGLLSLELLRRITANNQRPRRGGKPLGQAQPTALLWLSVCVLGAFETLISVSYFYEFGQVTRLTARLLGGDTLWTAAAFGSVSTVLTFIFSAVEGERTRIATAQAERAQEREERRKEQEQKRQEAKEERDRAEREREQERIIAEQPRYICDRCGQSFAKQAEYAGHRRWCVAHNGHEPDQSIGTAVVKAKESEAYADA